MAGEAEAIRTKIQGENLFHILPRKQKSVFSEINERGVDDITLEFFYKPHTITLLLVSIFVVIYIAFNRYI